MNHPDVRDGNVPGEGQSDRWLGWGVWALAMTLTAAGLALLFLNRAMPVEVPFGPRGFPALFAVGFGTVGAVIVARDTRNRIGWLLTWIGLGSVLQFVLDEYAIYALLTKDGSLPGGAVSGWIASWSWAVVDVPIYTFLLLLFPDGQLPSARWRPVAWMGVAGIVTFLGSAFAPVPLTSTGTPNPFAIEGAGSTIAVLNNVAKALVAATALASVLSLFVRLRRSRGEQRQQIKWFLYAATLVAVSMPFGVSSSLPVQLLVIVALLAVPLAVGVAILRYHLYDIDLLINRTLVYSALTVTLATVYLGSVVIFQRLFRLLTGQNSDLAIVVSTLAIAALFNPLRHRIQAFIDRRFYRARYDAQQTLAAFSASLRSDDNADLEHLSAELLAVIEETVQPNYLSLWLREPGHNSADGSSWAAHPARPGSPARPD
ncbi:MAG: hypothetical protein ACRDIB_07660 [Ardenticatenaceae bacterium]